MDQITHDVRRNQWLSIITSCQSRPEGITAKQWLADNGISNKTYYYWLRKFRNEAYELMCSNHSADVPGKSGGSFAEISINTRQQESVLPFSFSPDAVIRSGDHMIAVSNSASDSLIRSIMEVLDHAR